jgi:outer membrane protein TolC
MLNLITQAYVAGLRGESDIGGSWVDQFTTGAPSYAVGLQYEVPLGNRAACARRDRRVIELRQLQEQYRSALETVKAEVEVAVRELETSFFELQAKAATLAAANSEATTIEERWRRMIDGDGTASLNLESLLRAQERVAEAEYSYLQSLLTYNLSFLNLKRANGTLLQWENLEIGYGEENGVRRMFPDKLGPSPTIGAENYQTVPQPNMTVPNGESIQGLPNIGT